MITPSIAKEYQSLPEKEKIGSEIEYQNQIMFQNADVNLTYYTEKKIKPDEKKKQQSLHGLQTLQSQKTMPEK